MNPMENILVGASATESIKVTHEVTVAHAHPAMPEVYATPMMIYLMEMAASKAIWDSLPEGWVSVGMVVNVKHLAATPIGFTATATAKVTEVTAKTIVFSVEAHDGVEKIGEGIHIRAPVELSRFESRLKSKNK